MRSAISIEAPEATAVLKELARPHIPAEMRRRLAETLSEKVASGSSQAGHGSDANKQYALQVYNLFPIWLWSVLMDKNAPKHKIIEGVKVFLFSIGLVYATEPTYLAIVAAILAARHHSDPNFQVDQAEAKSLLEELKKTVRLGMKRRKMSHFGCIRSFPDTPEELLEQHPQVFARAYPLHDTIHANCPQECPLDAAMLTSLCAQLPSRSTHHSINRRVNMVQVQKQPKQLMDMHNVGHQLYLQDGSQMPCYRRQPQQAAGPNITYFPCAEARRQHFAIENHSMHTESTSRVGPLAIADKPPEPGQQQAEPKLAGTGAQSSPAAKAPEETTATAPGATIDEMASSILAARAEGKAGKRKQKESAKAKSAKSPTTTATKHVKVCLKRPAGPSTAMPPTKKVKLGKPVKPVKAPYPGKPSARCCTPIWIGKWKVYTDLNCQSYRIMVPGSRCDRKSSFKFADPKDAWKKVCAIISDGV